MSCSFTDYPWEVADAGGSAKTKLDDMVAKVAAIKAAVDGGALGRR